MSRMGVAALGLLLLLGGAASAEWAKLVGKEAPNVGTTWLYPCDGDLETMLGKVVVVVFWDAGGAGAGDDLFLFNELHERIYRRGGRVLALTAASVETTKPVLEAEEAFCPTGAATQPSPYGSGSLPYAYLVGPDRRVAWQGPFAGLQPSILDPVLGRAKPFLLVPMSKENKECADAFRKGMLVEASAWALDKAARAKKEAARLPDLRPFAELIEKEADYIRDMAELHRAYWWALVEEGRKHGDYDRMLHGLDLIQRHLGGYAYRAEELGVRLGDDARAAAEARKLDTPEVKRSLEASKALAALIAEPVPRSLTAEAKAKRLEALQEFQKKWEGTYAARRAARRAKWLGGLPAKG